MEALECSEQNLAPQYLLIKTNNPVTDSKVYEIYAGQIKFLGKSRISWYNQPKILENLSSKLAQ